MVKKRLMLGAAFAALSLVPLTNNPAEAQELLDKYDLDIHADWDNDVDVNLDWDVDVSKELNIYGNITIDGSVQADALSQATLDDKQFISENEVNFEDYQNAYQNEPGLNSDNEPGLGQGTGGNYSEEGAASGAAKYWNTVIGSFTASAASGNIGINMAAGDYNLQENAAVISSADGSFPAETATTNRSFAFGGEAAGSKSIDASGAFYYSSYSSNGDFSGSEYISASGSLTLDLSYSHTFNVTGSSETTSYRSARTSGAAEAGSFSLQSLYDNGFNTRSYELENSDVDNTVDIGDGTLDAADGNIGLNAAAGAFNIQKNALVIASVAGGHLAEATAGTLQHAEFNDSYHEDTTNNVTLAGSLTGTTGNIGVNLAAGVGNLQLNTLTIASALGDAGVAPSPPPPPVVVSPPPSPPTGGGG